MPNFFALLGHAPLSSASPVLQNAAFSASGIDARYFTIAEADPIRAFELARRMGLSGVNVTTPFKQALLPFVEADETAQAIGALNTIRFDSDRALGFNTDPEGVLGALRALGVSSFENTTAVILGTGGAARSAIFALREQGTCITILGREVHKAEALTREFGVSGFAGLTSIDACSFIERADLIVGTLSTRDRVIAPAWIAPNAIVLDANYGVPSQLLLDARQRGCRVSDGLTWLLHQGAAAFELWTERKAPIEVMHAALASYNRLAHRPRRGIALIGFSGAGKSLLALRMGQRLGLPAIDLDLEIEQRMGCSIPVIFERHGEKTFRKVESDMLRTLVHIPSIMSVGAGALLDPESWPLIQKDRLVVFLDIDVQTALGRIHPGSRPLLDANAMKSFGTLEALAQARLDERREGYARTCGLVLDATHSPEALLEHVSMIWDSLA